MAQVTKLTSNFRYCLGRDRILSIEKRTNILIVKRGIRRMWKFEELISKKKNARGIAVGMLSFPAVKNQLLLKFCNLSVKAFNILFADKTNLLNVTLGSLQLDRCLLKQNYDSRKNIDTYTTRYR